MMSGRGSGDAGRGGRSAVNAGGGSWRGSVLTQMNADRMDGRGFLFREKTRVDFDADERG